MKNKFILALSILAAFGVTACETTKGVVADVENISVGNINMMNPDKPKEKDKTNEYVAPAEPIVQDIVDNTADFPAYKD